MYAFFADSDPAAYRDSLRRVAALADDVDTVYPSHGVSPLGPSDVLAIRDAFEAVWGGMPADRHGSLYGHAVAIHDFRLFSFLLPAQRG